MATQSPLSDAVRTRILADEAAGTLAACTTTFSDLHAIFVAVDNCAELGARKLPSATEALAQASRLARAGRHMLADLQGYVEEAHEQFVAAAVGDVK